MHRVNSHSLSPRVGICVFFWICRSQSLRVGNIVFLDLASETGSATVLMYAYVRMCRSWTLSCTRILFFWHGCTGSKGQNFVLFGGYTFDYLKWYTAIHIRKFQAVFFTTRSISAHITLNTSF